MINFTDFYTHIEDRINTAIGTLFQDGKIKQQYNLILFKDAGDYREKLNKRDTNDIVGVFLDKGITRETESNIKTRLQDSDLELRCDMLYADDLREIITYLNDTENNAISHISNESFVTKFSLSYKGFERLEETAHDDVRVLTTLKFIIYTEYFLSNDFTLEVNGVNVPFNSGTISRSIETISDGRKRISQQFFQNTSGLAFGITIPFFNDATVKSLAQDISTAGNFGEVYTLKLYQDDLVLLDGNYVLSSGTIALQYGTLIGLQLSFIPASNIK